MNRCPVSLVVLRIKQSVVKLFFQSFSQYLFLLPCLHYVTMALSLTHSSAVAKAAGKAKAKAKTKVKEGGCRLPYTPMWYDAPCAVEKKPHTLLS